MRSPYTKLHVHLVWATWDRLPLITDKIKGQLIAAMVAKCHQLKAEVVAIELMPDHAHLLVRFPPTLAIADLVKEVKGSSSHLVNKVLSPEATFKWQGAYGAFTTGTEGIAALKSYIANQQRHHTDGSVIQEWEANSEEIPPGDQTRGPSPATKVAGYPNETHPLVG